MAAAHGKTVDHGYDRLRNAAYLFLHVEHAETWHAVLANVAAATLYVHVAARTERTGLQPFLLALSLEARTVGTGKHHHAYVLRLAAIVHCVRHLPCCQWSEGIAVARTVDSYLCYSLEELKLYFFVLLYFFPISHVLMKFTFLSLLFCKNTIFLRSHINE